MFRNERMFIGLCLMVSVAIFGIGVLVGAKLGEIKVNQYEVLFKE